MKKTKLIKILLSVFLLSLFAGNVFAQQDPGHLANSVGPGQFVVGDYNFPTTSNVGIGLVAAGTPAQKLEVNGNLKLTPANPYIYTGSSYVIIPNGLYLSGGTGYFENTIETRNGIQNDSTNDSGYLRVKDSLLVDSWIRTSGATGWYNQSYGGGWYMEDATWVRSYGSKPIYTGGEIRSGSMLRALVSDYSCARMHLYSGGADRVMLSTCPSTSGDALDATGNFYIRVAGGNLYIRGSGGADNASLHVYNLWKTGGNGFLINHPLKEGLKLAHISIEGPEYGVYYRGEARLEDGTTVVTLPDYFEKLAREEDRTVLLTAKDKEPFLLSYEDIVNGKFTVHGTKKDGVFSWEVKAVRKDVAPLKVEGKAGDFE